MYSVFGNHTHTQTTKSDTKGDITIYGKKFLDVSF